MSDLLQLILLPRMHYSAHWLISSIGLSLFAIMLIAMAQSDDGFAITKFVKTDKSEYVYGELITVFGNVGTPANNETLKIFLSHVSGESNHVAEKVPISENGSFSYSFFLSRGDREGAYSIGAEYNQALVGDTRVFYSLSDSARTFHFINMHYAFNGTDYAIQGRTSEGIDPTGLSISEYGVGLGMKADRDGVFELALPKTVIDGITLVEISVEDYTISYPFHIVSSNETNTVIKFIVPRETGSINISGSHMVPEFGLSRSVLIIATGIVGVIGVSMAINHVSRKLNN